MPRTSERTSLGYVLQLVVEAALRKARLKFAANCVYHPSFIKPDALLPGNPPTHSIHVTATGADNSFQMKRWRYIDEILQMRSVWKNQFVAINVMFGSRTRLQARDIELLKHLFDHDIPVNDLRFGEETYLKAIELVRLHGSSKTSAEIARLLIEERSANEMVAALSAAIGLAVTKARVTHVSQAEANVLSIFLASRDSILSSAPLPLYENAYWKRTILSFLGVSPFLWKEALTLKDKSISEKIISPRLLKEGLRARLLKKHVGISNKITLHPEVNITLKAGLDEQFLNDVKDKVAVDPRRMYELEDLWDNGTRASLAIREVAQSIEKGRRAVERLVIESITNGGSSQLLHHRSHVIDVLITAIGWSQNLLQERYNGPTIGVVDPIRNIVPRTEIAQQALQRNASNIPSIANAIVGAMWEELASIDWKAIDDLVDRYLNYRVYCLIKGSSIDPLEDFVYENLEQAGWVIARPNVTCLHPLIGRTTTRFTAAAEKTGRQILVKCLFGDTGADHKAEEMEARARIICTSENQWKDAMKIFIADGKWSEDHRRALFLGGWDYVIPVKEFKTLLGTL